MTPILKKYFPVLDLFWLALLALFVLSGVKLIPLHGDEMTYLHMSDDWYLLTADHDPAAMAFRPLEGLSIQEQATQVHRMINGPLSRYIPGMAWQMRRFPREDLPSGHWDWTVDIAGNDALGNIPAQSRIAWVRAAETVFLIGGIVAIFWLGYVLSGRIPAYSASALMALNPSILMHGRRVMAEGVLLGFVLITLALLAVYLRYQTYFNSTWKHALWTLAAGILVGLTFSVKHSGAVIGLTTAAMLPVIGYGRARWKGMLIGGGQVGAVAVIALALNYSLSPVYWQDPQTLLPLAWEMRVQMTEGHAAAWGGYRNAADRLTGLAQNVFAPRRSYYEEPIWESYIGESIDIYEASPLSGLPENTVLDVVLGVLLIGGIVRVLQICFQPETPEQRSLALLVIAYTGAALFFILLAIKINWQRYYALLWPVVVFYQGMGIGFIVRQIGEWRGKKQPLPG